MHTHNAHKCLWQKAEYSFAWRPATTKETGGLATAAKLSQSEQIGHYGKCKGAASLTMSL